MDKQKSPILRLIDQKALQIDQTIGLQDNQLAAIRHLVKTTFLLSNVDLEVHFNVEPKMIIVTVKDQNGLKLKVRPKHPELLDKILSFLGIQGYRMYFWGYDVGN